MPPIKKGGHFPQLRLLSKSTEQFHNNLFLSEAK